MSDRRTTPEIEPRLVEVAIALASFAGVALALLPNLVGWFKPMAELGSVLVLFIAVATCIIAALATYSALWLLAWHCFSGRSGAGYKEIVKLFVSPGIGPLWLIAWTMLAWFALAFAIGTLLPLL